MCFNAIFVKTRGIHWHVSRKNSKVLNIPANAAIPMYLILLSSILKMAFHVAMTFSSIPENTQPPVYKIKKVLQK